MNTQKVLDSFLKGGFISPTTYGKTISGNPGLVNNAVSIKNPKLPGSSNAASAIVAPQKTTLGQAANEVKASGFLPNITPIQSGTVSAINTNALPKVSAINPTSIGSLSGLNDSYYQNLSDQAAKRLQDQYFTGANNLSDRLKNQMNKRGLIGSGIEAGATTDLYKDFGSELADFQSNLAAEKARNDIEAQKFNIGNTKDITLANKGYEQFNVQSILDAIRGNKEIETGNVNRATDTAFKNQGNQLQLGQIALSAAGDAANTSTNFDTKIFQSLVDNNNNNQTVKNDKLSELNSILSNSNIDPQTRDAIEGILTNILDVKVPQSSSQNPSQSNNPITKQYPNVQPGGTAYYNGQRWRKVNNDKWELA